MKNEIFITSREVLDLDTYSLEKEIEERMNNQCNINLEEQLKRILDDRPRYSKRIPTKLYMKFHTIEIIRWEVETFQMPWKWYMLKQENEVRFKFRFIFFF